MKVYTVKEVAEILRLTPQTIRKYIKEGKLEAFKKTGKVLLTQENLDKFTKKGELICL